MKGLMFTEFMEMVEARWSLDMVDSIIKHSHVASGGAYTSVGNYSSQELEDLIKTLSVQTNTSVDELVRTFGRYLFGSYAKSHPYFFNGITDGFLFLSGIEDVVHAEVRRIYPDTELPTFEVESSPDRLTMTYFSERPFAELVHGLIEGCFTHFQQQATIERMPTPNLPGVQARFIITRQA